MLKSQSVAVEINCNLYKYRDTQTFFYNLKRLTRALDKKNKEILLIESGPTYDLAGLHMTWQHLISNKQKMKKNVNSNTFWFPLAVGLVL
jgi:hypothetical protein